MLTRRPNGWRAILGTGGVDVNAAAFCGLSPGDIVASGEVPLSLTHRTATGTTIASTSALAAPPPAEGHLPSLDEAGVGGRRVEEPTPADDKEGENQSSGTRNGAAAGIPSSRQAVGAAGSHLWKA